MKPPAVRTQIASGATAPLYLLEGDDRQARYDLALEFGALVDEGLHAFNVHSFYANEATSAGARDQLIGQVLASACTLPMMVPRRVLLVHEAERLLSPRKAADDEAEAAPAAATSKRKRSLTPVEELEAYLAAPEPLTTIVFVAGTLNGNRRLVKLVRRHAISVDCGTLEDAAEAGEWVTARLGKQSLTIQPDAMRLLVDWSSSVDSRTGEPKPDSSAIRTNTDKLALYCVDGGTIKIQDVRDVVTPPFDPGKQFALTDAIRSGNPRAALREISALLESGMPAFMILGQVRIAAHSSGSRAPRMADAQAKRLLDAVFETDLAIKSSMGEPRFLLERLVIEVCGR